MTNRERFLAVLNRQPLDRLPMVEWAAWWDLTIANWEQQGLAQNQTRQQLETHFGLDVDYQFWLSPRNADCPAPKGNGQPLVRSAQEYEAFKRYLYSDEQMDRAIAQIAALKPAHERGDCAIWYTLEGFFWFPRTLFGIEDHLYAFYDEPELMHQMNADNLAYSLRFIEKLYRVLTPEFMTIAEDMSYNHGPMLSKEAFDTFMKPYYEQLVPLIKSKGTKVLIDTDGDVEPLIPWFEQVGIQGVLPLERQAGVDVNRIRKNHPEWLMIGGYDKTIMHCGEEAMRKEFQRILPAMQSGGYIPAVDHQTPPDVSIENYRIYCRLLKEYTGEALSNR